MLKISKNESWVNDLISASESIVINRLDNNSKIRSKIKVKRFSKKVQKITKYKIFIRPENYDFSFKSTK